MTKRAVCLHGHFYQPPRENPWIEEVEVQDSASPFHDWNERITAECYGPNGAARLKSASGRICDIVNNYVHLSFNFGPTLLAWLERQAPEVYRSVLDADARSARERGHGNAIAQGYNHIILPLCNERDLRTQVRWGLADFRHRFGRPAEGMWLPEAAVNDDVLSVLAEEGVGFTVLGPGQSAQPVDTTKPYRWRHPTNPSLGVDIVFYDGGLSHDLAFSLGQLSSEAFVDRVEGAAPRGGIVTVATDGETFAHHHRFGDRLLAYALAVEAPRRGIEVTNVAGYLRQHAPVDDVT